MDEKPHSVGTKEPMCTNFASSVSPAAVLHVDLAGNDRQMCYLLPHLTVFRTVEEPVSSCFVPMRGGNARSLRLHFCYTWGLDRSMWPILFWDTLSILLGWIPEISGFKDPELC